MIIVINIFICYNFLGCDIVDKNIKMLRDQYYNSISLLQKKEDIENALPFPSYSIFYDLMRCLIEKLNEDFEDYSNLLKEYDKDSDDFLCVNELLNNTKIKIDICKKRLEEAKEKSNEKEVFTLDEKIDFIFAKSKFGEIRFINDLKSVPEESYYSIYEFLEMIHNRQNFHNSEKIKRLSGNDKLSAIYEAKPFKVRILFKFLDCNTVYIFSIKSKKSDNDSIDRSQIIERFASCKKEYNQLLEDINTKRGNLIEEHLKYKEQIYDYLKKKYRGNKKIGR